MEWSEKLHSLCKSGFGGTSEDHKTAPEKGQTSEIRAVIRVHTVLSCPAW